MAFASLLGMSWGGAVAAEAESGPPADTLAQRLVACTVCHGKQGEGLLRREYLPRIAGKPAGYLENQLINFREQRRQYPQMNGLLAHLSDDYLKEIADFFANSHPPYPAPVPSGLSAAASERAETLIRRGDADRQIPACTNCHGAALTGAQPAIPGLLGLPPDYLRAQLGAWKTGARHAHPPDCMATIARRMADEDISALASWLASQTPPAVVTTAGTTAGTTSGMIAPAPSGKLTMECGSVAPRVAGAGQP